VTTIRIDGEPLARFVFDHLPSVNDAVRYSRAHWSKGHGHTKKWRAAGEDAARDFLREIRKSDNRWLVSKRAFLWVHVYRANDTVYDVTNPYTKALQDGFTDAGIWPDDDWPNLPYALFSWRKWEFGGDPCNLFVVEVHELDAVYINGAAQALPLGRKKDDALRMAHTDDVMSLFAD
jgi:hypothetical protein